MLSSSGWLHILLQNQIKHLYSLSLSWCRRSTGLYFLPVTCKPRQVFSLISQLGHFEKSWERQSAGSRFPVVNNWPAKLIWTKRTIRTLPAPSFSRENRQPVGHQLFPGQWFSLLLIGCGKVFNIIITHLTLHVHLDGLISTRRMQTLTSLYLQRKYSLIEALILTQGNTSVVCYLYSYLRLTVFTW